MTDRERAERIEVRLLAGLIAAAILAAFAPILENGVLKWDDLLFVGKDAPSTWGWAALRWAFADFHLGQYVPLACLSHVADFQLWGSNAGGYHLTSLLWHAAGGLVWFSFWLRLLSSQVPPARRSDASLAAAAATLLFCLHPLRVESVAWLAERRDVLCGFFYAAALRLYLESCLTPRNAARWRLSAFACFGLSLLSKVAGANLPAALLILDIYPLRRISYDPRRWLTRPDRRVLLEKIPFAVLSGAFSVGTAAALHRNNLIDGYAALNLLQRLASAAYSVLFYVRKEFWPFPMLPVYEMPLPFEPASPRFLAWSVAAVAAAITVGFFSRKRPAVGASAAYYAVALVPVSGLVTGGLPHLGADRYSYFPSLAFSALAAAALLKTLALPRRRPAALAAAAAILLMLGAASWRRCRDWRNDESLWRAALAAAPEHREAHTNLSGILSDEGQSVEAAAHAEEAVRLDPEKLAAWINLGAAHLALSQWPQSQTAYAKAAALRPGFAIARRGLGRALEAQGRGEAAIEQLRAAADLDPMDAAALYELGNAYFRLGRLKPARAAYEEALRVDPRLSPAHSNLGRVLDLQGHPDAAVKEYRAAVAADPSPEALYNWANLESRRDRATIAARLYAETLRLDANFDDARFNWGNALARTGRFKEAAAQYERLLARRPHDAQARENLRRVTAAMGR
ncbi:MAG: tetratricopeptide repeat protein [Elusimicrobiota bacterium]